MSERTTFATSGPDSGCLRLGEYGSPVIALVSKPEGATPDEWAQARKFLTDAALAHGTVVLVDRADLVMYLDGSSSNANPVLQAARERLRAQVGSAS